MNQHSKLSLGGPSTAASSRLLVASGNLTRRTFLGAAVRLGLAGAGLPLVSSCTWAIARPTPAAVRAQIGVLSTGAGPDVPEFEALRRGLGELGYVEGQNVAFEYRFGQGNSETLPQLAAELVALHVDVIVAHGLQGCQAAQEATTSIPIVFASGNDPVALGFAASLARPGGNMTGLVHNPPGLEVKRLQLLKQACPGVSHVGILVNPTNSAHARNVSDAQTVARVLGVDVQPLEVHGPDQVEAAFAAAEGERLDGLLVLADAVFYQLRLGITSVATRARLAGIFSEREYAQVGGLIAYGANIPENFRRAATYVDKILKGARPADLPIEQPTRVDFVVNLKSAEALGITISPAVLEQLTGVIP